VEGFFKTLDFQLKYEPDANAQDRTEYPSGGCVQVYEAANGERDGNARQEKECEA
jgi:hypothetical protein